MADQRDGEPGPAGSRVHLGASGGSWYTWWRGDMLPPLAPLAGFGAEPLADAARIARLTHLGEAEVAAYLRSGHRCWCARLGATSVGYGWCAASAAEIGELRLALTLPAGNRYLWGFATDPAYRGSGIYPRLLQAILTHETAHAERFWIGHEPHNAASARGITKAGFQRAGELYFLPGGGLALVGEGPIERAEAGAAILGVPLLRP
jgi:ribosomal protein S18 acetylase RimI-like enzyme